jgi:hypothetical protein
MTKIPIVQSDSSSRNGEKVKTSKAKSWLISIKRWRLRLIIVLLLLALAFLAFGYFQTRLQLQQLADPQKAGKNEAQQIIKQVDNYLDIPQDEVPTLFTVKAADKLKKSKAFFLNAQNGDKVLVFQKSNMAILYRPSTKKVIAYSSVSFNDEN